MIQKGKRKVPWKGQISVDTVVTEFPSLSNKRIRAGVEKEIRSALASVLKKTGLTDKSMNSSINFCPVQSI